MINLIKLMLNKNFSDHRVMIRYVISGVAGAVIQFFGFYFFTQIVGIWYIYAVFLAFLAALLAVFLMQKFWTFRSYSSGDSKKQFFSYTLVAVGGALLNVLLMHILVDSANMNHLLAQAIVIICIIPISYVINRNVTFSLNI